MSYYITGGTFDTYPGTRPMEKLMQSAVAQDVSKTPEEMIREEFEWCMVIVREIMEVERNKDIKWISENERKLRTLFVFFLLERFNKKQISQLLNIPAPYLYDRDLPRIKRAAISIGLIDKDDLSREHNLQGNGQR